MDNTTGAHLEAQVKFSPPLHEQRRSWALEILRREKVTSVLDVGCGEGVFLQHLTHSPPWRAYSSATPAPPLSEKPDFIHIRELHGLDVQNSDLLYATDVTAPPRHTYGWTRFEQLDVSIWEGGLQVPNPTFNDIECIVATEVIEHLHDDVLHAFAPILLGNYSPRLLLFTTPSFDFNARFSAPGDEDWGFPDPTGRTTRTFRHADHKFEWTVDECVEWCKAAADEWGYEVVVDGMGHSITKDPWGRDADIVRASQAVIFRRREGDEWVAKRTAKYAAWASSRSESTAQPHNLLATHRYEAHPGAQKPASHDDIVAAAKSVIQDNGSHDITIFELWREDSLSTLCGGWLEVLVDVLDRDESFVVHHKEGKNADDWKVEAPGLELHGKNPWQNTTKQDDMWGESSETTTETYDDEEDYAKERDEEYDGQYWGETEDFGWAMSEAEASWDAENTDTKAGEVWKPAPGWLIESSWD